MYKSIQALAVALLMILSVAILKIGAAPYIAFAFCGSFLIFISRDRSRNGVLLSAAIGTGFGLIYFLHHGTILRYFGSEVGTPGGFLGMGAVQLVATRWICASKTEKAASQANMLRCALIPLLCMGSMIAVSLAAQMLPMTYDRVIYAFDLHLGAPSWKVGELFRAKPWLFSLCGHVYNSLPLALSSCLALQWVGRRDSFKANLGMVFMSLGVVGFGLYLICPVSGPIYLFPIEFPAHLPAALAVGPAPLAIAPRNGMPSLHVGWTFLLFWNLRTRRVLGPLAAIFAALTCLATLGSGEHYLADLLVAIPLALAVQCAWVQSRGKWGGVAVGGAITLAWLIAFRTGAAVSLPAGAFLWTLSGATILLPALAAWSCEQDRGVEAPVLAPQTN